MDTQKTEKKSFHLNQDKLLGVFRSMLMLDGSEGREDDEHPLPPGPWDPVIRVALERINVFRPQPDPWKFFGPWPLSWRTTMEEVFGPHPDPWKIWFASIAAKYPAIWDVIGGGPSLGSAVALNPQPLPPRFAFWISLAQTVISRAELFQEMADATRREGEKQGIIVVGGYIERFVDDFCGTGIKLRWPFPWPRPKWFAKEVSSIDLVVMGMHFDQASNETFNPELRRNLADASAKLLEAGLSKIQ